MAAQFNKKEQVIIADGLELLAGEVKKMMKKSESLGFFEEMSSFKQRFLEIERLRGKVGGAPSSASESDDGEDDE